MHFEAIIVPVMLWAKGKATGLKKKITCSWQGEGLGRSSGTGRIVENIERSPGVGTSGTASLKFYNVRIACGTFFCTLVISLIITP